MENKLLQCVSVIDLFNRNLFEPPTNNMCSKVILKFFYLTKVILKLHLDGMLSVVTAQLSDL